MPPIATEGPGGVPVLSADIGTSGPVYSHFEEWDEIREQCPAFWNEVDGGSHWVLTRFEAQREALQRVEIFSTESTIVSDPDPEYMLLPLFLDPASHLKYRQLYNARFSPGAVERLTPTARQACRETIAVFLDRGHCDLIHEFADVFPTQVFLIALGLPLEDAPQMVDWVRKIFLGLAGTDTAVAAEANAALSDYFVELLDDRRSNPPARKLAADIDYEGCPMKKGQMVLMPLWSSNRDGRVFPNATDVVLDRSPNRHIAFGAGPHRCAGSHLARRELLIAMEEWHTLIPDYEIGTTEPLVEHGWQLGLDALPLRWSRQR